MTRHMSDSEHATLAFLTAFDAKRRREAREHLERIHIPSDPPDRDDGHARCRTCGAHARDACGCEDTI